MNTAIFKSVGLLGLFILLASIPAKADQPEPGKNYRIVVEKIIKSGDALMENYSPQNSAVTGNGYSRLYFDVFESSGMEFNLGLQDDSLKQKIEFSFSQMINLSMNGEDPQVIRSTWDQLKEDLDLAVKRYAADDEPKGFWGLALQSFLILTREGMEAILVVAALVAYLRRSGNGEKVPVIWKGVGLALAASVATAWAFNSLIEVSGKNRESLEGFTLLLAAAMLLYVSYWLYSKSGSDRWQVFIKGQMDKALSGGSLFALGAVSFLAVYREGAETILFYQALVSGTTSDLNAIWVGVGLAALTLAVIYYFVRVASIRLPISLFFSFTAFLLFLMALVFTGQGLLELQISGLVSSTPLTGWPQVDSLGLYPTLETLSGQLVMLGLFVAGLCWMKVNKKSSIALMKKLLANESK